MKVRRLATLAEAYQWFKNGDHPDDFLKDTQGFENGELRVFTGAERKARDWEGSVVRYFRRPDIDGESLHGEMGMNNGCGCKMNDHGWIDDGGNGQMVCPGDWIVKEHGRYLVLHPFEMTSSFETVN